MTLITVAPPKKNGKEQPAAASSEKSIRMEVKAPEIGKEPVLSIDEKIQKVHDLTDLIEKRGRFLEARTKLNSFNLKREESTTKVAIEDQSGNRFITSHSDAIEKILSVLRTSIDEGLAETEKKIQF